MDSHAILQETKSLVDTFIEKNPNGVIVIWGATATGKTALSV